VSFKNDLRDGKAIYWYETGEKQGEGSYIAGTGKHTGYYRSGKVQFERSFKDGKKEGVEKYFDEESGKIKAEISFHDGLRDGYYVWFLFGKKLREGNFVAGTGKLVIFDFVTGKSCGEEYYKDDKRDGEWRLYYSDGKIYYTGNFSNGNGKYKYTYMNGNVVEEGSLFYKETDALSKTGTSNLSGKWQSFYKSGAVKASALFSEGKGEGKMTMFYPNGAKLFEGFYNGSQFEGKGTWYYPSGTIKHTSEFTPEGKLAGKEDVEKALFTPHIERAWLELYDLGEVNDYINTFMDNPNLLTQDVRDELQQYRVFIQDAIPDFENLMLMHEDGLTMLQIRSLRKIVLEKLDGLIGKE
jgi:antitoxin component YwqK of YwqJK toxin-antitoxin module